MRLLFASFNPHKVSEVRAVMRPFAIDVVGLDELADPPPEPREDGLTFGENARIKAVHCAKATGRTSLADDSGLEVDALGGVPGVRSARYAGVGATRDERDRANIAKLLEALEGVPAERRTARFVCAMCLSDPGGNVIEETRGVLEGVISDQPAGTNGFGYDPLLYLPREHRTCAQLSPDQKNARSHRGQAARAMAGAIVGMKKGTEGLRD
ncbi:MAG: RdgB/HAM1 family non-canonical purine NTP pyrophosphatase [Planctomycetota bacterium]|jgi:XTP/dITP diphosphohydrolase